MVQTAGEAKHASGDSHQPPMSSVGDCERGGEDGDSRVNMSCKVPNSARAVELELEGPLGGIIVCSSGVAGPDLAASW
jgi:hypothetical protein